MDFPLENIHKRAFKVHESANCAGDQDKYWEMHERLFSTRKFNESDLAQHAEAIGLNLTEFNDCLENGKYASEIRKDITEGRKAQITGTPSFLIGLTNSEDTKTVKATVKIRGAQPYARFKEALDKMLSSQD